MASDKFQIQTGILSAPLARWPPAGRCVQGSRHLREHVIELGPVSSNRILQFDGAIGRRHFDDDRAVVASQGPGLQEPDKRGKHGRKQTDHERAERDSFRR